MAALLIAAASTAATAQGDWPKRTISLVVPYAPGGYTDSVGRITARYLEKALGANVIVENRAGAGGIVGTAYVAKSAPDGYTLCVCSVGAVSVAPVAQKIAISPAEEPCADQHRQHDSADRHRARSRCRSIRSPT